MNHLFSGAMVMGYFLAGLFFLRFWYRTRDVLFMFFAVSFWILAGQRLALGLTSERFEDDTIFYVARLLAFILIIVAIWNKNRSGRKTG